MLVTYQITLKTYLYKYISYYNLTTPHFQINDKNRLGIYIRTQLLKRKTNTHVGALPFTLDNCSILKVAISTTDQKNYGIVLEEATMIDIAKIIKDEFQERMIDYIFDNRDKNYKIYATILAYREKYGICEDELPFKTMIKWWERQRHRINGVKTDPKKIYF